MIFKAVLSSKNEKVPRIHDLIVLYNLVSKEEILNPFVLRVLELLNTFAVDIRYPNDFIITEEETEIYLKESEKVVKWVKENFLENFC